MKKLMAIILAATMAFGLAATATADGTEPKKEKPTTKTVELYYTVAEKYTWNMPAYMKLEKRGDGKVNAKNNLCVSDAFLQPGKTVKLGIASGNARNGVHYLKNGTSEIPYTIEIAGNSWEGKTGGLIKTTGGTTEFDFTIITLEAPDAHVAGEWTDTITFTTEIVDDTANSDADYCNVPRAKQ